MKKDKTINSKLCKIRLEDMEVQYTLRRSSRKTIGITVEKDGTVKVHSPYRISEDYINQLLQKKSPWILEKVREAQIRLAEAGRPKTFSEGECLNYLGKQFKLKIARNSSIKKHETAMLNENILLKVPLNADDEKIRGILKRWYIDQFKLLAQKRVVHYSRLLGRSPGKITVREQKTRWGSCSAKGNINLNWKLIMAPLEVVDYVIVHELCHLKEMNHSKNFWKLVEGICPEYIKYRTWLKKNGDNLTLN